jgi:hypothetical protein
VNELKSKTAIEWREKVVKVVTVCAGHVRLAPATLTSRRTAHVASVEQAIQVCGTAKFLFYGGILRVLREVRNFFVETCRSAIWSFFLIVECTTDIGSDEGPGK